MGPEHLDVLMANEAIAAAGPMAGFCFGRGHGSHHMHGPGRLAHLEILPARVVRPGHAVPGGQRLAAKDPGADRARPGREADLDLLMDVCGSISLGVTRPPAQTTIYVLGPSTPPAVAAGLRMFRDEYLAHIPGRLVSLSGRPATPETGPCLTTWTSRREALGPLTAGAAPGAPDHCLTEPAVHGRRQQATAHQPECPLSTVGFGAEPATASISQRPVRPEGILNVPWMGA